jgi:hypothetical protein
VQVQVGDVVSIRMYVLSSKLLRISVKLDKWSVPLIIREFAFPVPIQLANADADVIMYSLISLMLGTD